MDWFKKCSALIVGCLVVLYFVKAYITVDISFQEMVTGHSSPSVIILTIVYEIVGLIVVAIVALKFEDALEIVSEKLNLPDMQWVKSSTNKTYNVITVIMLTLITVSMGLAWWIDDNNFKIGFFIVSLLVWAIWFLIIFVIECSVTSVSYPVPTVYIVLSIMLLIFFITNEHTVFYHDKVLNKEVILRFAEAFMVVGGRVLIKN